MHYLRHETETGWMQCLAIEELVAVEGYSVMQIETFPDDMESLFACKKYKVENGNIIEVENWTMPESCPMPE